MEQKDVQLRKCALAPLLALKRFVDERLSAAFTRMAREGVDGMRQHGLRFAAEASRGHIRFASSTDRSRLGANVTGLSSYGFSHSGPSTMQQIG